MAVGYFTPDETATPDDIDRRRKLAMSLMQEGSNTSPVQHWTQGAARMAKAISGAMWNEQARADNKALTDYSSTQMRNLFGFGGSPGASTGAGSATVPAQMPSKDPALGQIGSAGPAVIPDNFRPHFEAASQATGIPVSVLAAKAQRESSFNPDAIGKAGEIGLTQVMPSTARDPGFGMQGIDPATLRDPATNVMFGAQYLAARGKAAGVNDWNDPQQLAKALTAYNGGGDPNYASSVMRYMPSQPAGPQQVAQASGAMPTGGQPDAARIAAFMTDQRIPDRVKAQALQVYQLTQKPQATYGEIGVDAFGRKQFGWIDPRTQTIRPQPMPGATSGSPVTIPGPNGPVTVPPGQDPKAYLEALSKRGAEDAAGPKPDDVSSLRREVQNIPSYKNFAQAAPIYRSMEKTAGTNSKASDLNLVYGLGKIFDPGSVVREGEMIMVKNTASLPDWLVGAANSLNGGQALTPETRKAIMAEAHNRLTSYQDQFNLDAEHYRGIAGRAKMNIDDVIPNFGEFKPWVGSSNNPASGSGNQPRQFTPEEIEAEIQRRGLRR